MAAQRETIARAALGVLLEKGVYATSQRDICRAADISNGALYTHFKTREEAIAAACALDHAERLGSERPTSWDAYIATFFYGRPAQGSRTAKRFRLSLQFVAELTQMADNPESLSQILYLYREDVTQSLAELARRGIVELPLGLAVTTEIHMQLFTGAEFQLAADRSLSPDFVFQALTQSLAITAKLSDNEADNLPPM
jgi:AcrR family transcriptional regulator